MSTVNDNQVRYTSIDRLMRRLLTRQISSVKRGTLIVSDGIGIIGVGKENDLKVSVKVHNPRFYRHAILGGTLSIAESYLNRDWDCDHLTDLFRLLIRNLGTVNQLDGWIAGMTGIVNRIYHSWHANTRRGSQQNIAAHYDLGNDFYQLWLDKTLAYSCGIFADQDSSLEQASLEKFDRVCKRLALTKSDHVIEIGTGRRDFAAIEF